MINLGFLASGRGTNMQAVIDACNDERLNAAPVVVISNNGSSQALDRAEAERIPAYHLSSKNYPVPDELDQKIAEILQRHKVDLVVLAGYMKLVGPKTLSAYEGRVINIHPALLPKYGGGGMYGKRVHEAVLTAGETETGITIHIVDDKYDHGPIIAQRKIPVQHGDTADTLAERVLAVEHEFYVDTIDQIIRGEIKL